MNSKPESELWLIACSIATDALARLSRKRTCELCSMVSLGRWREANTACGQGRNSDAYSALSSSVILLPLCCSRRAGTTHHDLLIQFLIHDLDRAVDLGIGHAKLMRNQLHQQVDPLDERRSTGHCACRRRGFEKAFRRLGVFLERHLILRLGPQTPSDRIYMVIDRLRELQIVVHRVADRLR